MVVPHSRHSVAGTVKIDETSCKQCGLCARICPAEVLVEEEGRICIRDDSPFGCIACGHCMMVCPDGNVTVTGRGISPEDLLPLPEREEMASPDALAALMKSRRSVRRFKDREVDAELLDRVVKMASSAPMAIPPWDVGCTVVRGRDKVRDLAGKLIEGYEGFLKIFRPWVLTLMRPFMGKATNDQFRNFIRPLAETYVRCHREGHDVLFWGAPAVLIFHRSPYAEDADVAIACTYAMLAAESLGLGTTIIGGAPPVLQRNKALCESLGIPKAHKPSFALIVGHPATHFKRAVQRHFVHVSEVS